MHRLYHILLFLLPMISVGQNLVPNPSFEIISECPSSPGDIQLAEGWEKVLGSPDLYSPCDTTGFWSVPQNNVGFQYAQHGTNYVLIAAWWKQVCNAREFIGISLEAPLSASMRYNFKMHVSLIDTSLYALRTLGAYFSSAKPPWNVNHLLQCNPQVEGYNSSFLSDTAAWMIIEGSFIAEGTEKYLTIGNFKSDEETDTLKIQEGAGDITDWTIIAYYIDSVGLELDTTYHLDVWEQNFAFSIYPNPATTNLTIESRTPLVQVWVRDVAGRVVLPALYPSRASGYANIDVSGLPSGIYLVEVLTQNGQRSVQKVVVE